MDKAYRVSKNNFSKFVDEAIKQFEVWAPAENNAKLSFKKIEKAADANLSYVRTTQGAKKIFHPAKAEIFNHTQKYGYISKEETPVKDIIILGLHPCDLNAVIIQDKVFADSEIENAYLKRRKNAVLIAAICDKADDNCFCGCMDSGPGPKEGFDLLITDLGSDYLVEAGSVKGEKLLETAEKANASDADLKAKEEKIANLKKDIGKKCKFDCSKMKTILQENFNHDYWKNESDRCLSCGSCTNVCPTCFCYSINDNLDWDGKTEKRELYWDSCQNKEFSLVALGENFRPERVARLKQFVNHKLNYWHDQFGSSGCVGCGRCIEICPVEISLLDIVEKISK